MTADISNVGGRGFAPAAGLSAAHALRHLTIALGLGWALAFIVLGLHYQLQLYGDGSIFSYAVAVRDAWAFHWHNISGRLFVYLYAFIPAEGYVALTGDARGGIALYGLLFFSAPLLGLAATFLADRTSHRTIFVFACASTACLGPLVFGFPTEMWLAHALFWPALAICQHARAGFRATASVFLVLLALLFTHAGAVIFALTVLATLLLRDAADRAFLRCAGAFAIGLVVWAAATTLLPPDDYFAPVLTRAALHVFDLRICTGRLMLVLFTAFASYGVILIGLRRAGAAGSHLLAAASVAAGLAVYWLFFASGVHAENRYYLRTVLIVVTPALGILAAAFALRGDNALGRPVPLLPQVLAYLASEQAMRAALGALALLTLIHAVETTRFITAWTNYKAAVRSLALGTASDPSLGNPRFVSSQRIARDLNRLSWFSTTPYLSVLLAPGFAPARLVVDPKSNYFWLSCATAAGNARAPLSVPSDSRALIQSYSCLHRP